VIALADQQWQHAWIAIPVVVSIEADSTVALSYPSFAIDGLANPTIIADNTRSWLQ